MANGGWFLERLLMRLSEEGEAGREALLASLPPWALRRLTPEMAAFFEPRAGASEMDEPTAASADGRNDVAAFKIPPLAVDDFGPQPGGPTDAVQRSVTSLTSGNDTVTLDASDDTILALDGDDYVDGRPGADTIYGDSGNDQLIGGAGFDSLYGGVGDDFLNGDAGNDVLYGAADGGPDDEPGADTLIGDNGFDTLYGGGGNDTLIDDTGVDRLFGGQGDDSAYGGDNVDTLFGDDGSDRLFGGSEVDTIYGGSGDDVLFGNQAVDVLYGASPGAAGNELGNDTLFGGGSQDRLFGGGGDDSLYGEISTDTMFGGSGDDFLVGGDNNDTMDGGSGSDFVSYQVSPGAVTIDLNESFQTGGNATDDFLTNVEHVIGSSSGDTLLGSEVANTLLGGNNTDTLAGRSGADFLYGGSGRDTALYNESSAAVSVDLSDELLETGGHAEGDFLTGVENLVGSAFADRLIGDELSNMLQGGGGGDYLDGGLGSDSLFGGAGDDTLQFDASDATFAGGGDVDTLVMTEGADVVQLGFPLAGNPLAETTDIEAFMLGGGNDWFLAPSDPDAFNGLDAPGFQIFGGSGRDYITMRGENAVAGTEDYVDGGSGNDVIWGGWGGDTLIGGAGDDYLYGGKGNDSFYGGSGFDVFYVGVDEGDDTIQDTGGGDNGLVLFWGFDSTFGGNYDGVDPSEVSIAYGGGEVTVTLLNSGSTVTFAEGEVTVLNLWDYGDGDAGNTTSPPGTYERDVWSATWDGAQFTSFVLAVDG